MSDISFTPKFSTKIEVTTSGEGSIKSISLNGKPVLPDENGNVDLDLYYIIHATLEESINEPNDPSGYFNTLQIEDDPEDIFQAAQNGKIIYCDISHPETFITEDIRTTRFTLSTYDSGLSYFEGMRVVGITLGFTSMPALYTPAIYQLMINIAKSIENPEIVMFSYSLDRYLFKRDQN